MSFQEDEEDDEDKEDKSSINSSDSDIIAELPQLNLRSQNTRFNSVNSVGSSGRGGGLARGGGSESFKVGGSGRGGGLGRGGGSGRGGGLERGGGSERGGGPGRGGMQRFQSRREVSNGAGKNIFNNIHAKAQLEAIHEKKKEEARWADTFIVFPMGKFYRSWWMFTVIATAFTFFFETYQIAFPPGGLLPPSEKSSIVDFTLITIFAMDMLISFNLAYFNEDNELVYSHKDIATNYISFYFWIDLLGVMPFYLIALAMSGQYLQDNKLTQYLALLRLLRLVRMRRVKQLFDIIKFSTKVSLMSLTLTRNGIAAMVWTHFAACVFYFISKQYDFDADNTWIGPHDDLSPFQIYILTLYWSVVTFTTVGYGDLSPVNAAEQIFGMIYMLFNIILMSYIIGSITLLVVKNDEATGMYRDNLETLYSYCTANGLLDDPLYKRLKTQLKVEFNHRNVGDEMVLNKFPKTMRQKVLYKLYSPSLEGTNLLKGIRQHFITDFLSACRIVIFSSGEELLTRGAVSSDLFLLVEGEVQLSSPELTRASSISKMDRLSSFGSDIMSKRTMGNKDFINEISFFTESPQIDTVKTLTVCKTLIISKHEYKSIADDHPGSVGRLLHNLLNKVKMIKEHQELYGSSGMGMPNLPKSVAVLRAGSDFDQSNQSDKNTADEEESDTVMQSLTAAQTDAALSSVQDLVEMHINKQKDDHTTRFLFAANRDDIATIRLMCDQGFDPDSCDYDSRTALMVASMKGNVDAVEKLVEYGANPHMKDHHGTCALLEAIENGHDVIIDLLLNERTHPDMHWLDESRASSLLNQAVFDGNVALLQRLVKAGVDVNAGDYDMRRPVHVAASEGNMSAFKILVNAGADLSVRDRWDNSVMEDAKRAKNGKFVEYLQQQTLFRESSSSLPSLGEEEDEEEPMES
jgi:CRP-like cAMP-binding protein